MTTAPSSHLPFLLLALWCSVMNVCHARSRAQWNGDPLLTSLSKNSKHGGGQHQSHANSMPKAQPPTPGGVTTTIINVLDYGAKADGLSDDSKAFMAAWAAACKVQGSTLLVPSRTTFLVGPTLFSGPYSAQNIVFQLDGTIIAPTSPRIWSPGLLQWLDFSKLKGITIRGSGILDGQGSVWWNKNPRDSTINSELASRMPSTKPTALRFYGSTDVTVTGITIRNSPQCHLKFDNCINVNVYNLTVSSPPSPQSINTDGIHLQNSRDVTIHSSSLGCGDDCISIQTGCSNVFVHNVKCGPGHGISIGGLGKDNTKACVSNITVRDILMHQTMNGVRVKTWQGGSGSVDGVLFSNIQVSEVQLPIVIDQYYCDGSHCKNQSSAVALSKIQYENIKGSYTVQPIHFACSDSVPCTDISLANINLQPIQEQYHMYQPLCWQAFGVFQTTSDLPPDCMQVGKPTNNKQQFDRDSC